MGKNNGKMKFYTSNYKNSKKKKKDKKDKSRKLNLKTVHMSLDKKDIKAAYKIVTAPVDVPKKFVSIRDDCNHAGDIMTVETYKSMVPNYSVYTPMLDPVIERFGEDSVAICSGCFDVLVNYDAITSDDIKAAMTVLYVSANKVLSMRRLKKNDQEDLVKLKNRLSDWVEVMAAMDQIDAAAPKSENKSQSQVNLNDVGNTPFTI